MIQWKDHRTADGRTYCLQHLHPTEFEHRLPATQRKEAVTVKVHVSFSLHTFTRKIEATDAAADHYADNRETRCFDYDRYERSRQLPQIIQELPAHRKIYFSRTKSGLINYATFAGAEGSVYAVFFDVCSIEIVGLTPFC